MTKAHVFQSGDKIMTQAEVDAFYAAKRATKLERAARKARLASDRLNRGPRAIDRLTSLGVGASYTFPAPKYRATTQTSSMIRSAWLKTGARYTSRIARDLIDGQTVIGVTVTRTE